MPGIDLHTHSSASDGTLSPARLVALAQEKGLSAIALTDHDTVSGLVEALAEGKCLGVRVIPGIEISTQWEGREIHLLGYFIDHTSPALLPALEWTVADRNRRNEKMVALLQKHGFDITMEMVEARATEVVGRPHIARTLVETGQCASIQEAFDRYLAEGRPFFLPRTYIPMEQAIRLIHQAGGAAVLAHPLQYELSQTDLLRFIEMGARAGADGLEVYYSGYTPADIATLTALAQTFDLVLTGGSDFHGENRPHISLGRGPGDLLVPEELVEKLETRAKRP